jgi:hypothetical protein
MERTSASTIPDCRRAGSDLGGGAGSGVFRGGEKGASSVGELAAAFRERVDMATANADVRLSGTTESSGLRVGSGLMALAAVGFIGYAVIFFVRNFTDSFLELGIGHSEVDVGKDQITQFSPSLYHYISHLHIAVSGFIAATGLAVLFLVWFGVRRGYMWAWVGAVAAPVVGLAVALPAHYPNDFDTMGHLGLIYLATVIFVAGALMSVNALMKSSRS